MGRGGRANLAKTGSGKNNRVDLDQRNPPGVFPFVWSILGRAEAASKSRRQSWAWGKWNLPAPGGKGGAAAVLLETAHLPSESPATDHQCWLFLSEAAFQGKITLTGLEMSQLNDSVKNYWFVKTNILHGDLSAQRKLVGRVMRKLWRNQAIWFNSSIWNVPTFLFQNKLASLFFLVVYRMLLVRLKSFKSTKYLWIINSSFLLEVVTFFLFLSA